MLTLQGHKSPVRALAYSPDGTRLLSGGSDGTLIVWNVLSAEAVLTTREHTDSIRALAFFPDGDRFVSAGWDDHLYLHSGYRWGKKQELQLPQQHPGQGLGGYWSVTCSADGRWLAAGCGNGKGYIWECHGDRLDRPFDILGHSWPILAICFSPDGKQLATAAQDNSVRLWDAHWGIRRGVIEGHTSWVRSLAFSPDNLRLVSAGDDRFIRIWDPVDDKEIGSLHGHEDAICQLAFTPDGNTLISGGLDGTVRLWDWHTGCERAAFNWGLGRVLSLSIAPDGLTAAAGGNENLIVIWDLDA